MGFGPGIARALSLIADQARSRGQEREKVRQFEVGAGQENRRIGQDDERLNQALTALGMQKTRDQEGFKQNAWSRGFNEDQLSFDELKAGLEYEVQLGRLSEDEKNRLLRTRELDEVQKPLSQAQINYYNGDGRGGKAAPDILTQIVAFKAYKAVTGDESMTFPDFQRINYSGGPDNISISQDQSGFGTRPLLGAGAPGPGTSPGAGQPAGSFTPGSSRVQPVAPGAAITIPAARTAPPLPGAGAPSLMGNVGRMPPHTDGGSMPDFGRAWSAMTRRTGEAPIDRVNARGELANPPSTGLAFEAASRAAAGGTPGAGGQAGQPGLSGRNLTEQEVLRVVADFLSRRGLAGLGRPESRPITPLEDPSRRIPDLGSNPLLGSRAYR
jgi:hypothetical protein